GRHDGARMRKVSLGSVAVLATSVALAISTAGCACTSTPSPAPPTIAFTGESAAPEASAPPTSSATARATSSTADLRHSIPATVLHVVDGDTIHARVNGVDEKVRIIGMDSPETSKPDTPVECFAKAATAAAKRLLKPGDPIVLQPDPTQAK